MAKALSNEQLVLVKWRLEHGETPQGRPFYDDPKFAKWCEAAKAAKNQTQAGQGMPEFTLEAVAGMHAAFVNAQDGATAELEAWSRFCGMLAETEKIRGAVNAPLSDSGERALHRAAETGRLQNLAWLLQNGADANATTAPAFELAEDGSASLFLTPVHVAATYGQVGALELLKQAGADLNSRRPDGTTALDLAQDAEQTEAASWLLSNGAMAGADLGKGLVQVD
jgi:ankyrin repeat protein